MECSEFRKIRAAFFDEGVDGLDVMWRLVRQRLQASRHFEQRREVESLAFAQQLFGQAQGLFRYQAFDVWHGHR